MLRPSDRHRQSIHSPLRHHTLLITCLTHGTSHAAQPLRSFPTQAQPPIKAQHFRCRPSPSRVWQIAAAASPATSRPPLQRRFAGRQCVAAAARCWGHRQGLRRGNAVSAVDAPVRHRRDAIVGAGWRPAAAADALQHSTWTDVCCLVCRPRHTWTGDPYSAHACLQSMLD